MDLRQISPDKPHKRLPAAGTATSKGRKPVVVFDMNFSSKVHHKARYNEVTHAGLCLAQALRKSGTATPHFLTKPLSEQRNGGNLPLPKNSQPLIFALSLYDYVFAEIIREVSLISALYPDAKIIVGGPSVNTCKSLKELASFFPRVTAFVKGDGEKVFPGLISALAKSAIDKFAIYKLQGVYVKDGDFEYCDETTNVLSEQELNERPGITAYPALIGSTKSSGLLSLHTSRGCLYRCVFCSDKYHAQPIHWTAERIVQELRRISQMIKKGVLPREAKTIWFTDDDFFHDRQRVIDFLTLVANDPNLRNTFKFTFQGSVASFFHNGKLDLMVLYLLTRVKVEKLCIGTDGHHPFALKYFGKGNSTHEMARELMRALEAFEIRQLHYVIMTYPEITSDILIETLENILRAYRVFKKTIAFSFNFFLIAVDGNALMRLAERRFRPKHVASPTGAVKHLPFNLPILDEELNETFSGLLEQPFIDAKSIKEMGRRGLHASRCRKKLKRLTGKLVKWRKNLPRDYSLEEALKDGGFGNLIQVMALRQILNSLYEYQEKKARQEKQRKLCLTETD